MFILKHNGIFVSEHESMAAAQQAATEAGDAQLMRWSPEETGDARVSGFWRICSKDQDDAEKIEHDRLNTPVEPIPDKMPIPVKMPIPGG